jgi:hypothetical protein
MLTFRISLYCPKAYHKPDHSIRLVEYHRKKLLFLNPSSLGLEPGKNSGLSPLLLYSSSRNKQFCSRFRSSIVLSYRITEIILTGTRTQDRFRGLLVNTKS